jgi:hypothetical protein
MHHARSLHSTRRQFLRLALAGGALLTGCTPTSAAIPLPEIACWPLGRRAAVAFTFDWETAMGGLIHSRSVNDPNVNDDYLLRARRMREGIATTRAIFAPHGIRATYYATGYNFLFGNRERRTFLGDPTFAWASRANGWLSDRWVSSPWFGDDPFGTVATHPEWYFGDLIAPLRADGHEIQSHTFSHLHGGLADRLTWQQDLETWNRVAAAQGVAPARSLAFPWSSSAGMSDASWSIVEQAGIRSVTRMSDQAQYSLWEIDQDGIVSAPCGQWLPGREGRIRAYPDCYLTPASEDRALRQLDRAIAIGGIIDLWAHTEEVTSAVQIATWQRVTARVAGDAQIWVAPLGEIAAWEAARVALMLEPDRQRSDERVWNLRLTNPTDQELLGLALKLPVQVAGVRIDDIELKRSELEQPRGTGWWPAIGLVTLDLGAGQTVELQFVAP